MKTKVWVETPFGDFEYVPTNFEKGSSCSQCAAKELGRCCELACDDYDDLYDLMSYHLERRFK